MKSLIVSLLFHFRNKFILLNPFKRANKGIVNLNFWEDRDNLGDLLSPIIVQYMLSIRSKGWQAKDNNQYIHLYAIGSIITAGLQDCVIWGSGFLTPNKIKRLKGRNLDIRAVRGPLTQVILLDNGFRCPSIYGDPAIFLPLIYSPKIKSKKYKFGVIKHLMSEHESYGDDVCYINIMTKDYKNFVDNLMQVECVISSSLHGIIIAESYGIPAVLLRPSHDLFKYYDWYYSTLRCRFPIASSVQSAMSLPPPQNCLKI